MTSVSSSELKQENNNKSEEFLTIPPTNVIDEVGMKKLSEAEAIEEAQRLSKFQEIRFKDGETRIVRIDPTKTEFKEDVIQIEGQPGKHIWRYTFSASEYIDGKWTKFKVMKFSPKWGRQIIANNKEGNLTLKITRKGSGLETDYQIVVTNAK